MDRHGFLDDFFDETVRVCFFKFFNVALRFFSFRKISCQHDDIFSRIFRKGCPSFFHQAFRQLLGRVLRFDARDLDGVAAGKRFVCRSLRLQGFGF
jgi:hypothetical protein